MDTILSNISVHTKVRKLAYVKFIVEAYLERAQYEANFFPVYLERKYGTNVYKKFLMDYKSIHKKDDKGEIINSGKGNSAYPYIRFAEKLLLLYQKNYVFSLSKYGKVYKVLLEQFNKDWTIKGNLAEPSSGNPFLLNTLDKFIFLKQILKYDFLYFINLLDTINQNPNSNVSGNLRQTSKVKSTKFPVIKEKFIDTLNNYLSEKFKSEDFSFKLKNKINDLLKANKSEFPHIPIRKFESIIEPRMGWLLDLDFIDGYLYSNGKVCLSSFGKRCLNIFKDEFDIVNCLETKWVKVYSNIYDVGIKKQDFKDETLINQYLKEAFTEFKTMIPNRITISQAVNYTSYKLFFKDGIIAEYDEIKKFIFSQQSKIFDIDWFASENDGSLKLI